ncbi:hypothetical protein [Microbacterium sp. KR10-403]|uniref:hypothetical protein n=1 Tax=Microbacterium sp. KR10-403 TaxID=3158581 RepID=UPI0032E3D1DA
MKGLVTYSLDYPKLREAIVNLDADKRRSLWSAYKSGLITALEVLITPRLNAGKKAHTFTIAEVMEIANLSQKEARLAVGLAKQLKVLITVEGAKFDPITGKKMASRYMANFAYWEETIPHTVSALRLAMIACGAYGNDWAKASIAVDRQLESFRVILEERGQKMLTVKRIVELLLEVDGKQWARVVRRAKFWGTWDEVI